MSGGAPVVVAAGGGFAAEDTELTHGASRNVGVAGAGAAAAEPAAKPPAAVAAPSTNGDAPTTAVAAAPVVPVSRENSDNGHHPEGEGENEQISEVVPASKHPFTASRKRKAGEEVPQTPAAEPAEAAAPAAGKTTLLAGVRVEDLTPAVRARMEEVLREGEDDGMRKDVRLINFLGEVEEAQALAALNEYHAAVSETSVTIRNKPAYLMGILRKYKQGQRAPMGNGTGGGMATAPNAMGRMGVRVRRSCWSSFIR